MVPPPTTAALETNIALEVLRVRWVRLTAAEPQATGDPIASRDKAPPAILVPAYKGIGDALAIRLLLALVWE